MKKFLQLMKYIKNNLSVILIITIILALVNVYITGGLNLSKNILIGITISIVILPVMINLKLEEIVQHLRNPKIILFSLFINFIISPGIAYAIGKIFFIHYPNLFIALMILSFIPTSSMTAVWSHLSKGRMSTAMFVIPLNLLFSAFIAIPFILPKIVILHDNLNSLVFLKSIFLVFIIPAVLGILIRLIIIKKTGQERYNKTIKPELGGISSIGIIILTFLIISLTRTRLLFENTKLIWIISIPLLLYYLIMIFVSHFSMKILTKKGIIDSKDAIVLIYASSVRHLNITLAVILFSFSIQEATLMLLFIALGFIIQIPLLSIYAKKIGNKFIEK